MGDGSWSPLLTGDARRRAIRSVTVIPDRYRASAAVDPTLTGGAAGIALLFSYLAEFTGDEADGSTAVRFLEEAIEDPNTDAAPFEGGPVWPGSWTAGCSTWTTTPALRWMLPVLELLQTQVERLDLVSGLTGLAV